MMNYIHLSFIRCIYLTLFYQECYDYVVLMYIDLFCVNWEGNQFSSQVVSQVKGGNINTLPC